MSSSKENQYSGQLSAGTRGQGGQAFGATISGRLEQDGDWLDQKLAADRNFDVVTRTIEVGVGRRPYILLTVSARMICCRNCCSMLWI